MANMGRLISGALGGAGTGAGIGSFGGPMGTAVGAGVGGFAGLLSQLLSGQGNKQQQYPGIPQQLQQGGQPPLQGQVGQPPQGSFLGGQPAYTQQLPRFQPGQQDIMGQLAQMGLQGFDFPGMQQRAEQQFQQQTVPGIAGQFTGATGGALSSPSLMGQLGEGGAGLQANLQDMQMKYLAPLLEMGLQPSFENIYVPQAPGAGQAIGQGLGQALPGLAETGLKGIFDFLKNYQKNKGIQKGATGTATQQQPYNAPQQQYQPFQSPAFQNLQMLQGGGF